MTDWRSARWTLVSLAPLAALALLVTACTSDDDAGSTTSSTAGAGTSSTGALDWDGVRFDFGLLTGYASLDGQGVITFQRIDLYSSGTPVPAAQLTEEPVMFGNTDAPGEVVSSRERRFVLDPDVEILYLVNPNEVCPNAESDELAPPEWGTASVDDLVEHVDGGSPLTTQVSLTFNDSGLVERVRLSSAC
jgi:hypothetical protein